MPRHTGASIGLPLPAINFLLLYHHLNCKMGTVAPEMAGLMKPRLAPKELCCLAPGYTDIRQKTILAPFLQIPNMRPLLLPASLQLLGTDLGTPNEHHLLLLLTLGALRGQLNLIFSFPQSWYWVVFLGLGEPGSGQDSNFQPLALLCRARAENPCPRSLRAAWSSQASHDVSVLVGRHKGPSTVQGSGKGS